ncbi:exosortase-associated protein EpsI, V-type [Polymorphobacter fuscus]|uniref:EpsI family protein n=1 Tax=Sandarakinorhabdus fusca TaxID=1439888 RepID=A0A7C9GNT7_9SPHN|nr:exosortase-associated protein EpsI, V-type [Polymorphobacter fuscus]KAB7648924.1 EpsI family protein [Polymorphobacter fuscus]MQT16513.1 EpsI family protein [Polymorphobacter fuscus]NJC07197.1 EpsI family protein [Polymorphobacter fuscus]
MNRRDILLGGGLIAAAASAEVLRPRDRLVLLPEGRALEEIVPKKIGSWRPIESDAFVLPKTEGSLADRLYNQTLTRFYEAPDRRPVMLVIAYGAVQNDLLQLHRPETCYSAVGFAISDSRPGLVRLSDSAKLPTRELTARSETRVEPILYWTRIGDDLPTTGREQRWVKLRQQMRGYLADGVLVRMSTVGEPSAATFVELGDFARIMMETMKPADRPAFIGRRLAGEMA